MNVEKEGVYRDADGNLYHVKNVSETNEPYFRAYHQGGWYNVNSEPDNYPFDLIEIEMVEYVGEIPTESSVSKI